MSNQEIKDAVALYNTLRDAGYTPAQAAKEVDETFGLDEE